MALTIPRTGRQYVAGNFPSKTGTHLHLSADSPSDETLNQGPLALLLRRQYEFPFGINKVQFSFLFNLYILNTLIFRNREKLLKYATIFPLKSTLLDSN